MIIDARVDFARKRELDRQKKKALAQFGGGPRPPAPEDPEPTRMTVPSDDVVVEAIAECA